MDSYNGLYKLSAKNKAGLTTAKDSLGLKSQQ